ncbi:MAG TPA: glycosyltransferase [bacterium]|nr:glycosyltransferase [bacterium]HQO34559.1 glycosyltransferase [bacterium]
MKIWSFDDPQSFGARTVVCGALRGMEECGWHVRAPRLDPAAGMPSLKSDLQAFSPDCVFFVNQPPGLYYARMGFRPDEWQSLPYRRLVWILDDPFILGNDPFHPEDIILIADPAFETTVRQRGGVQVHFLPVAADIEQPGTIRDQYAAPVGYVGSVKNMQDWSRKVPSDLRDYLDRIVAEKVRRPAVPFEQLLQEIPFAPGRRVTLDGPLAYYLYVMANNRFRIELLEQLVPFGLQLYGGSDWPLFVEHSALQHCYRGILDPITETPDFYRSAAISINLRSLQGFTAPTQRDFNIPAAGGFLLSADLGTQPVASCVPYWEGIRSPTFRDATEIVKQTQHLLSSSNERMEWVNSVRQVIHRNHRYVHRVERIAEILTRAM